MAKKRKIKQWIKDNKFVIISIGVTSICIGGGVWLIKSNQISKLSKTTSMLNDILLKQADRIIELEELCIAKDDFVSELASELLRQGNSIGGQLMADKKAFLQAVA